MHGEVSGGAEEGSPPIIPTPRCRPASGRRPAPATSNQFFLCAMLSPTMELDRRVPDGSISCTVAAPSTRRLSASPTACETTQSLLTPANRFCAQTSAAVRPVRFAVPRQFKRHPRVND